MVRADDRPKRQRWTALSSVMSAAGPPTGTRVVHLVVEVDRAAPQRRLSGSWSGAPLIVMCHIDVSGFPHINSGDEDGFICLVASDLYRGFVGANWQLDGLLTRSAEQMNCGALFIAYAGRDAAGGELRIVAEESPRRAEREAA